MCGVCLIVFNHCSEQCTTLRLTITVTSCEHSSSSTSAGSTSAGSTSGHHMCCQQQPLQSDLPADAAVSSKGGTLIRVQAAASTAGKRTAGANCSSTDVRLRGSTAVRLLKVSASVPEGVSRCAIQADRPCSLRDGSAIGGSSNSSSSKTCVWRRFAAARHGLLQQATTTRTLVQVLQPLWHMPRY
jgi:hypothetical protein